MAKRPLTRPRRKALAVLYRNHPRAVRVSNATEFGGTEPRVYWQTARWLLAEGLVNRTLHDGVEYLSLSNAGLGLARRVLAEAGSLPLTRRAA